MKTLLVTALASAAAVYAITGVAANALALETDYLTSEPPTGPAAHASVQKAAVPGPWMDCAVTTYGPGYHGQSTATRERYDDWGWTFASPVARDRKGRAMRLKDGRYKPAIAFGTVIEIKWGGKSITGLRCNDTCIGGTVDVTKRAMVELLGRYEDTKLKGAQWRVVK